MFRSQPIVSGPGENIHKWYVVAELKRRLLFYEGHILLVAKWSHHKWNELFLYDGGQENRLIQSPHF